MDSIGIIKIFIIAFAYEVVLVNVLNWKEKNLYRYLKLFGACLVIFILSWILHFIFSLVDFRGGMNFLAYLAFLSGFIVIVPLSLIWLFFLSD